MSWWADYNTRVVVVGVALLGAAAGLVGSFTLLRKRALLGDALAHASLPGLVLAFILTTLVGGNGKALPWLLAGGTLGGLAGIVLILALQKFTRLRQDAALGIVLSVFFGAGVALLGISQQMPDGAAAGLETFIYGKTASMKRSDATLIAVLALVVMSTCLLLFKEFKMLCFDADFAGSSGLQVGRLDLLLMVLVITTTMIGLQAVGLILIVALLVIPPAAARFWTDALTPLAWMASAIGLVGGVAGAAASAVFPKLPSGPMIVLTCSSVFLISMLFGVRRGVVPRWRRRRKLDARIARQHLLRGIYEQLESLHAVGGKLGATHGPEAGQPVAFEDLLRLRSWSATSLTRQIRLAEEAELVEQGVRGVSLTPAGYAMAAHLTRQHRLWELYLVHYADVATARVDRDADAIEHVLAPEVVAQLERLFAAEPVRIAVPTSVHAIGADR